MKREFSLRRLAVALSRKVRGGGRPLAALLFPLTVLCAYAQQWVIEGDNIWSVSRNRRTIFTFNCNNQTFQYFAGCLTGYMWPPGDACSPSEPEHYCEVFRYSGGVATRFDTSARTEGERGSCREGAPIHGNGRSSGSGQTMLRLVWTGNSPPPAREVRVITAFRVSASAQVGGLVVQGCGDASATSQSQASASVSGGPGFSEGEGLGNSVSVSTSNGNASESKFAISKVWVLPVIFEGDDIM